MAKRKICKQLIAAMCIFLVLCSPLSLLLSHRHECVGEDCPLCYLLDASKSMFALLMTGAAFLILSKHSCQNLCTDDRDIHRKDATLVLQKVKLTD